MGGGGYTFITLLAVHPYNSGRSHVSWCCALVLVRIVQNDSKREKLPLQFGGAFFDATHMAKLTTC